MKNRIRKLEKQLTILKEILDEIPIIDYLCKNCNTLIDNILELSNEKKVCPYCYNVFEFKYT